MRSSSAPRSERLCSRWRWSPRRTERAGDGPLPSGYMLPRRMRRGRWLAGCCCVAQLRRALASSPASSPPQAMSRRSSNRASYALASSRCAFDDRNATSARAHSLHSPVRASRRPARAALRRQRCRRSLVRHWCGHGVGSCCARAAARRGSARASCAARQHLCPQRCAVGQRTASRVPRSRSRGCAAPRTRLGRRADAQAPRGLRARTQHQLISVLASACGCRRKAFVSVARLLGRFANARLIDACTLTRRAPRLRRRSRCCVRHALCGARGAAQPGPCVADATRR